MSAGNNRTKIVLCSAEFRQIGRKSKLRPLPYSTIRSLNANMRFVKEVMENSQSERLHHTHMDQWYKHAIFTLNMQHHATYGLTVHLMNADMIC